MITIETPLTEAVEPAKIALVGALVNAQAVKSAVRVHLSKAVANLRNLLQSVMRRNIDARNRIMSDVRLNHMLAGSIYQEDFLIHSALMLRKRLVLQNKEDGTSLWRDPELRQKLIDAFIDAVSELSGDLSAEEVRQDVMSVMAPDLFWYELKEEDGTPKLKADGQPAISKRDWRDTDDKGQPTDKVPFGVGGKPKLDKDNLCELISYFVNSFNVITIEDGKAIAIWDGYAYTEREQTITAICADFLKSYDIQKPAKWVRENIVSALSVSSEPVPRDTRLLLPTRSGVIHIINNSLDENEVDEIYKDDVSYLPPLDVIEDHRDEGFELCRPSKDLIVTNCLDVSFDWSHFDARADKIMHEWADNKPALYDALCEGLGWSVSGNKWLKGLLVFAGEGGCGKTKALDAVRYIVGRGKYSTVKPKSLEDANGFRIFKMVDARVNVSDELSGGEMSDELQNNLKDLSGGEAPQDVNEKQKSPYDAEIQALMLFATNKMPFVSDATTRKRFCVIPFLHKFETNGKLNVKLILRSESGKTHIFNEMVRGLVRLCRKGTDRFSDNFTQSKELATAMQDFEDESSSVSEWIKSYVNSKDAGIDRAGAQSMSWFKLVSNDEHEAGAQGVVYSSVSERDNLRGGLILKRCDELYYKDYKDFCKQTARKPDGLRFFKRAVPIFWKIHGFDIEVRSVNYYDLQGRRQKGDFFVLVGDPVYCPKSSK